MASYNGTAQLDWEHPHATDWKSNGLIDKMGYLCESIIICLHPVASNTCAMQKITSPCCVVLGSQSPLLNGTLHQNLRNLKDSTVPLAAAVTSQDEAVSAFS